jgi:ATP-dependent Clp protease adaptor protein ClpS
VARIRIETFSVARLHQHKRQLVFHAYRHNVSGATERLEHMATRSRDGASTILEAQKSQIKPPPLFKVMLLNDDYTPMEFVVVVLQTFFALTREQSTQIMLAVHREGMGVCGVYPRDIAATKVEQVLAYARKHQHPLQCVMEET